MSLLYRLLFCTLGASLCQAQAIYPSTAYAGNGDTLFLTTTGTVSLDFNTTGENVVWDYSALLGVSQQRLVFRDPKETGFNAAQWPYIQNTNNVNLSSTNGQRIVFGSLQTDNPNEYYKKTGTILQQSASSYDVYINNTKISIKNTYTSPDVIYHFPVTFGTSDSSEAAYATTIPNLYYTSSNIHRKNAIDGWGSIMTPYGTFPNALRMVSTVHEKDSIAVYGTALPVIYNDYREIKWLDASSKFPVMIVKQTKINGQYVTSTVSYLDQQQYFEPIALFAFYPLSPSAGDTVRFQNLSTNSTSFQWSFGDDTSADSNASAAPNPSHIFTSSGTFYVTLVSYNGPLQDSVTLPLNIGTITAYTPAALEKQVAVFPNPCNARLFLTENDYAMAILTNLEGQTLQPISIDGSSIDVSSLGKGYYLLHLLKENGMRTILPFIKQ